jgi:hypothetical protein
MEKLYIVGAFLDNTTTYSYDNFKEYYDINVELTNIINTHGGDLFSRYISYKTQEHINELFQKINKYKNPYSWTDDDINDITTCILHR